MTSDWFIGRKLQRFSFLRKNGGIFIMTFLLLNIVIFMNIPPGQADSGSYIYGSDNNYPPQEFLNNGDISGFSIDLLSLMATQMESEINIQAMVWSDAVESLKNGSIDFVSAFDTPERREFFDFSETILEANQRIFVREDVFGITSVSDLANRSVAVQINDVAHEYLMNHCPDAIIVAVADIETALGLLDSGSVFASFGLEHTGRYYAWKNDYENIKIIGDAVNLGNYCYAVKKGNTALLSLLNQSLATVKSSGDFETIYNKWYGNSLNENLYLQYLPYIILVISLALIIGVFIFTNNMILRKKIQEKNRILDETNLQLMKQDKIESLGVLAAGIAHDFNNILTEIMGTISLVKLDLEENSEMDLMMGETIDAVGKAKKLTQQLLSFSKGGQPIKEITDLTDLVANTVRFASRGSNCMLKFDISDEIPAIEVDPGQISQVINNITLNAIQAMPDGGNITIKMHSVKISELDPVTLEAGNYVKISISDTGKGIPEENQKKIFDPFFTTKNTGSGLGLAISYNILKKHRGTIEVESEVDFGSSFHIYIPTNLDEIYQSKYKKALLFISEKMELFQGSGRVMIMDDQKEIRQLSEKMFSRLGYKTSSVSDGDAAIRHFKRAMNTNNPFNIVVLDLTIPGGMGGMEVVKELKKIEPDVIAIVSSGYSNIPILSHFEDYGFDLMLKKPYTIEDVSKTLAKYFKMEMIEK